MDNIKTKYLDSLTSAQNLIDNKMYTSSVHCSYYSTFQMMKFVLAHKCAISYDTQDKQVGNSSHTFIITEIINNCKNPTLSRKIKNKFDVLKSNRVDADYHDVMFSDIESLDCIDLSKSIQSLIKQQFGAL